MQKTTVLSILPWEDGGHKVCWKDKCGFFPSKYIFFRFLTKNLNKRSRWVSRLQTVFLAKLTKYRQKLPKYIALGTPKKPGQKMAKIVFE